MLLSAGAVSDPPHCPLCRADITGLHETSASEPPADVTTSVEETIPIEILSIPRNITTTTGGGMSRIAQLLRQLQALRTAPPHFFTDFA